METISVVLAILSVSFAIDWSKDRTALSGSGLAVLAGASFGIAVGAAF